MHYILKNERVKLVVSDFGAEMTTLMLDGFEYLWTPDPAHYGRVSPCLFPITGRFLDGYYIHGGKKYEMQLNGVAMEKTFRTEQISDTELTMTITDDEETRAVYPFSFELVIRYQLSENFVKIGYTVTNHSLEPMPYSVGNHTAYRWPLVDGDNANSYFIRFQKPESLESFSPFGWRAPYVSGERIRPLDHSLYENGTRSFRDQKSEWLEYTGSNCDYVVRMYNEQFPFVANWAKPNEDANIVCIEPCLSISNHGPTMFDREGVHILESGAFETSSYCLELYRKSELPQE